MNPNVRNNPHRFAYPKLDKPSRREQRLSEAIPRKNICSEPGASQHVLEPKAADISTSCPFANDRSARRDEGSSDDDAAVAPGSANSKESVESGHTHINSRMNHICPSI
uniref:Uncharacterized protein n=1 Tax=Brassica oleracea TaxID=3712 RepID=A0A3P6DJA6_BRAOL|nr:unnamed protein product [Brassica oleracea]